MLKIPHDDLVFAGDGQKALFLRNDGDAKVPNLRSRGYLRTKTPLRTSGAAIALDG